MENLESLSEDPLEGVSADIGGYFMHVAPREAQDNSKKENNYKTKPYEEKRESNGESRNDYLSDQQVQNEYGG